MNNDVDLGDADYKQKQLLNDAMQKLEWGGISGTFSDFSLDFGDALMRDLCEQHRGLFVITGFGNFSYILYSSLRPTTN